MIEDRVFAKLEDATLWALDDYMAYRAYQGSNGEYYKKARIGIPVLSTYGRVRGTRANERQLAILERRIASGEVVVDVPLPLAAPLAQGDTGVPVQTERAAQAARQAGARKAARKS